MAQHKHKNTQARLNAEQIEVLDALKGDVRRSAGTKRVYLSLDTKRMLCKIIKEGHNDTRLFRQTAESIHSGLFTLKENEDWLMWSGRVSKWVLDYESKLFDMKYAVAVRRPAKQKDGVKGSDDVNSLIRLISSLKAEIEASETKRDELASQHKALGEKVTELKVELKTITDKLVASIK